MNYIGEIKAFHDLVEGKQFSTGQIALWYGLMYINNKCAWNEWFSVPNITLELHTGLSRAGILKARNILKQNKTIDFRPNGTRATSYKLISLVKSHQTNDPVDELTVDISKSKQGSKQDSNQVGTQGSRQDGMQNSTPLNKRNETKLNNKESKKEANPKRSVNNFQVIIDQFTDNQKLKDTIWSFIQMRINKRARPTDKALELVLKHLVELSIDPGEQILILNQSIINNWTNVYGLKNKSSGKITNNHAKVINDSSRYDFDTLEQRLNQKAWGE